MKHSDRRYRVEPQTRAAYEVSDIFRIGAVTGYREGMLNLFNLFGLERLAHLSQFDIVLFFMSWGFMSCYFMPCKLVRQFHVRHVHVQHFQRPPPEITRRAVLIREAMFALNRNIWRSSITLRTLQFIPVWRGDLVDDRRSTHWMYGTLGAS